MDAAYQQEIERHYRHNFIVNVLEVSSYSLGLSFASLMTILPLYLSHLTTSTILIGLIPALANTGWALPQLFTANYVGRLPRKKPFILAVSINERLAFLLLALSILCWPRASAGTSLTLFFVLVAMYSFSGGLVGVAWQDFIAKLIPLQQRGIFFGVANSMGGVLGALGAYASRLILERYPFPTSFAICFLMAFAAVSVSWGFLALSREPTHASLKPRISNRDYWRHLPAVLRRDRNFTLYLLSRAVITLGGMAGGFITVYAVGRFQIPDQTVGWFTAALLVGQAISNPLLGHLGDRRGHKLVIELATMISALAMALTLMADSVAWFFPIFALMGCASSGWPSSMSITFEFCAPEDRPTYTGLTNTL
ncbi:MAG TPA: MFS transporter, partial [Anaerolineae bacterium]|nr:MFS transporter [Anaerolineae bacterium]